MNLCNAHLEYFIYYLVVMGTACGIAMWINKIGGAKKLYRYIRRRINKWKLK